MRLDLLHTQAISERKLLLSTANLPSQLIDFLEMESLSLTGCRSRTWVWRLCG
jgi:hypothetical protein